jgi:hypothetical protein
MPILMNFNTDTAPLSSNPSPVLQPETAELLTPQQTARKLNISRRCLAKWTRAQRVPMIKLGRVCRF